MASVDESQLRRTCEEFEYRIDVSLITNGVYTEHHQMNLISFRAIDMAETRQNKASEAKLKITGNILAFGPQIQVIHRKQTCTI
jgi:hypothetical protein